MQARPPPAPAPRRLGAAHLLAKELGDVWAETGVLRNLERGYLRLEDRGRSARPSARPPARRPEEDLQSKLQKERARVLAASAISL